MNCHYGGAGMIKVNILNLKNFLETINQCSGRVLNLLPDGTRRDINKQYSIQRELEREYIENGRCLPMTLEFDDPGDYLDVVAYYAGDC